MIPEPIAEAWRAFEAQTFEPHHEFVLRSTARRVFYAGARAMFLEWARATRPDVDLAGHARIVRAILDDLDAELAGSEGGEHEPAER